MKKTFGNRYQIASFKKEMEPFEETFEHESYLIVKSSENDPSPHIWHIDPECGVAQRCFILLDDGQFIGVYPESFKHVFKIVGVIKKGKK